MKRVKRKRPLNVAKVKSTIRGWKLTYITIVLLVLALIVLRLALPGIVKHYVNKKLNELPGYTGYVEDIDIALWRGAYVIKGLHLKKKTDPAEYPFLRIERSDLSIEWGPLFHGRLVGKVTCDRPIVNILATESISNEPSKDSWTATLKALMPITINLFTVNDGRFAYYDFQKKPSHEWHLDNLHLEATNLANVQKKGERLPSDVNLSGTAIGGGRLKSYAKVNMLKEMPDFDGGIQLTGIDLLSLNPMLEADVKFDVERGKLDLFSKLSVINGEISGYVKPFIKDLKVLDVKKDIKKGGPLRVVKKAVVGLAASILKNHKTKKIATVVQLHGNINTPKTSAWQTFLGILKNAFIRALHESIGGDNTSGEPSKG
ncbi:MAG TPA: DUF748 domain-containing protein [Mucilaginibacter sp.]|jgi:hypothetical protein|nr:DUF748 domain-containing protein [Mucilaginibacter sp.]